MLGAAPTHFTYPPLPAPNILGIHPPAVPSATVQSATVRSLLRQPIAMTSSESMSLDGPGRSGSSSSLYSTQYAAAAAWLSALQVITDEQARDILAEFDSLRGLCHITFEDLVGVQSGLRTPLRRGEARIILDAIRVLRPTLGLTHY